MDQREIDAIKAMADPQCPPPRRYILRTDSLGNTKMIEVVGFFDPPSAKEDSP